MARRSTTERGYDGAHRELRRRLLPLAYGTPCPFCGLVMLKGQALDLDHTIPLILGGGGGSRIAHRFLQQIGRSPAACRTPPRVEARE